MKKLVIGILAHVDAGKTTLSEAMLFSAGAISRLGRVDYGDSFLDNNTLERKRGITIFSKQALLDLGDTKIMLLDTPGHVDFSAEMERTLSVLDAAVLVISGTDGVQGHTETLAGLLKRYDIPTFVFVNKMDLPGADRNVLMAQLKKKISASCIPFGVENEEFYENLAMCDDALLEQYLAGTHAEDAEVSALLCERRLFPVFFGSALKNQGVQELLYAIDRYLPMRAYDGVFGAKVFKISYDEKGTRLTFMKITGGSLRVKALVEHHALSDISAEKVDQLRIYSGNKFQLTDEGFAGDIVAVTGLFHTYAGESLGAETEGTAPALVPVFTYRVVYGASLDAPTVLKVLRILEEEDPSLHVYWQEQIREIHIQLMGEIQLEILKSIVRDRFDMALDFETGNIVYKETIKSTVIGVGHYEPLRHYGEVHLLLEPAPAGSGITISSDLSTDELELPYQKQILNSLEEKVHLGVLTGAPVTDIKITLVAGRAHLKHTEGGDLREAAWRAVRNGLMYADNVLLEPYYSFRLELPMELVGRAMNDLQRLFAHVTGPEIEGETAVLTGQAPVATLHDYQKEVLIYTSGRGKMSLQFAGYAPCHNSEEVLSGCCYEPEADVLNSPDSVFCAHGAGFTVPWYDVQHFAHVRAAGYGHLYRDGEEQEICEVQKSSVKNAYDPEELDEIFRRTYGVSKREKYRFQIKAKEITAPKNPAVKEYTPRPAAKPREELLIVDGFNIIFAWKELRELMEINLDAAVSSLVDTMMNYYGFTKRKILVVFDAYKVKGRTATRFVKDEPIQVVFTGAGETADMYIEKFAHEKGRDYRVTVATSDGLEQLHILSQGAVRMSARELHEEVQRVMQQIREHIH